MIEARSDAVTNRGIVDVSGEVDDVKIELAVIIGGVFDWLKAKDPEKAENYRLFLLANFADPNSVVLNLAPDDISVEAPDTNEHSGLLEE